MMLTTSHRPGQWGLSEVPGYPGEFPSDRFSRPPLTCERRRRRLLSDFSPVGRREPTFREVGQVRISDQRPSGLGGYGANLFFIHLR